MMVFQINAGWFSKRFARSPLGILMQRADEFLDVLTPLGFEEFVQLFDQARSQGGIVEIRGANLNRAGPGD